MKRSNLTYLLFYFLVVIVFFILGIYIAGILGAGEGQMLAAATIVLGWGFIFALFALIISIFIVRMIKYKILVRANWVLLSALIILYGITHYRYLEKQKTKESNSVLPTTIPVHFAYISTIDVPLQSSSMGIGFFQPNFYQNPKLNFYGGVNLEKSLNEHTPNDSLVFTQTELGFSTSYAPAWLFPEHMKLDYGIIMFKVLGYGDDFLKVETNRQTKQFNYVDKTQGRFITWPEMLLSVFSLEPLDKRLDKRSQTIHIKPLPHSSKVLIEYDFLKPLLIEGEWMYVKLVDDGLREKGKGWIRWKEGNQLLINYSLLS